MSWFGTSKERQDQQAQEQMLQEILADIMAAKQEMETALQNFNNASNDELVDVYCYQFNAAQTKCNYLVRKAKEHGVHYARYLGESVSLVQKNCS